MTTIAELRRSKNKVKVIHRRWYSTDQRKPEYFLFSRHELEEFLLNNQQCPLDTEADPRGGTTEVIITTPDNITGYGYAECSLKDNYNRKMGVIKAMYRALKDIDDIKLQEIEDVDYQLVGVDEDFPDNLHD